MTGLFTTIEQAVQSKLSALISTYLIVFAEKMIFLIQAGAPILILYYGYSIMSSRGSNATVSEMMWNLARIGMIFAFMQNTGNLLDLSIGFIQELKGGFVGADSVFSLLDQQLLVTQGLTASIGKLDNSWVGGIGILSCTMVWLGTIILLSSAAIVFISAEVVLVLLLTTAPIFIGCLAYGFLKESFNGWLRAILSCIITFIFASLVVRISINLSVGLIADLVQNPEQYGLMTVGANVLITGIIISYLIFLASRMAGNIAGVAASSAIQGGMTAAAAGAARFGGVAGMAGGRATIQGGRNLKSNISASVANRAKLAESVQKAALERVKQNNLK